MARATEPVEIRHRTVRTPLFEALYACTPKGLCFVTLTGDESQLERWRDRHEPGAALVHDRRLLPRFADAVRDAARGREADLSTRLDLRGTAFQRAVWRELLRIPRGATRTYGEIARRVGRPTAFRAVGRANASNPVPLAVPCHRVVGASGLGGFTFGGRIGGLDVKRALLELEGAAVPG